LDVLLGAVPDGVNRLDDIRPHLDVPVAQNIGIPSQLLQRRPDLRAMERRLVASDARIAVAIAQRLPSLRLGASLYRSDSVNYSGVLGIVSASFIQPLLDWGMREAEVKRNRALYEEQIAAYAARYLLAIEEVENNLYAQMQQRDYLERLEARRAILQLTVEEAQAQYLQGISDYLPVLNALEALDETERMMVQARFDLITYRLTLYRALGSSVSLNSTTKDPNP
jgi:outer membrane protein TolC